MKGNISVDPTEQPISNFMVPSQQSALPLVASSATEYPGRQLSSSSVVATENKVAHMKSISSTDKSIASASITEFKYVPPHLSVRNNTEAASARSAPAISHADVTDFAQLSSDARSRPISKPLVTHLSQPVPNTRYFPVQLTTSRIGNLTRLIHTLLYVMPIHTYIHTYIHASGIE